MSREVNRLIGTGLKTHYSNSAAEEMPEYSCLPKYKSMLKSFMLKTKLVSPSSNCSFLFIAQLLKRMFYPCYCQYPI